MSYLLGESGMAKDVGRCMESIVWKKRGERQRMYDDDGGAGEIKMHETERRK
ncbi:hypothetical protein BofuT4_uP037960.1 [Botrytis cinerea T4]|uniref:Uncharacterized protein n=1 Tax=Botryotinia fuckeliana (strain T4) TaxID=999810 RepID=G2Y576_BOTF4|nr:hypothetical protein BofuT4_uP037960.1 [Botrytis cinerea T4]